MAKKVSLAFGHGGSDPGAVANGLVEKDINLVTGLACKDELERHGVIAVCSRLTDENDPWRDEVNDANKSGADLAVAFHVNAGGGKGFEGFYHTSNENGKRLILLAEKYVNELGQNSRSPVYKSGNKLGFIRNTKMTAVLFESFFLDSDDRAIGDTIEEQKAFGVAYAKAILEYLEIAYIPVGTEPAPVPTPQPAPAPTKILEDWAQEVKAGLHGNGHPNREASLKAAGCPYDYQAVRNRVNEMYGVSTPAATPQESAYYPKYTGESGRIDEVLSAIGVPEEYRGSYKKRKPLAEKNGVKGYAGTGDQNLYLIGLAKNGKLKKM